MLSRDDIQKAIAEGELKIYPFEKKNLTGIGYNLSTTNFAFSINQGILLTIHERTTNNGIERYVVIPGNDTVLFFSKEYISVSNKIAGTFHSKVARVCQGLGHVSTTLDPTWKGQLILSISNPTSNEIPFDLDKNSGNIITMLLYQLDTMVTGPNIHDNNQGRCDMILEHFTKPIAGKEYQNKHLQLREFVVGKFADSLNGYDRFIDKEEIADKFSKKITQLTNLKKRLEEDQILIREKRYKLGDNGVYHLFRNIKEKELLSNCSIYELKAKTEMLNLELEEQNISNTSLDFDKIIESYLSIINYELETINHIRRIGWQNKKVEQFASEDSELVLLRKKEIHKRKQWKFWGPLVAMIIATLVLLYVITNVEEWIQIDIVVVTIYAPVLTVLLQEWYKSWKKLEMDEKARKGVAQASKEP